MERVIKVLVEKTQQVFTFTTEASTLGEVKDLLTDNGVELAVDDIFKEARSKGSYTADDTPLPTNIPWRGATTNDLVFKVVAAQTKIKSGSERHDLYEKIKELGLAEQIKEEQGRNFTQVPTDVLREYVDGSEECLADSYHDNEEYPTCGCVAEEDTEATDSEILKSIISHILPMDREEMQDLLSYLEERYDCNEGYEETEEEKEYRTLDEEFNF